nr:unnamed protein product [Spirometra erinaceieuropaei]
MRKRISLRYTGYRIYTIIRKLQLRWSAHLVRIEDERRPKQLLYGDVTTDFQRRGGRARRYDDTLKSSLKRLQINPTNVDDLARGRPTRKRAMMTSAVIYEVNCIPAAKAKREARKHQLPHLETPTLNRAKPVRDVSGRSEYQSVLVDISEPAAAPGRHHPMNSVHICLAPFADNEHQLHSRTPTAIPHRPNIHCSGCRTHRHCTKS